MSRIGHTISGASFIAFVVFLAMATGTRAAPDSSFFAQPVEERELQQKLPQSHDTLWPTLRHTVVSEDTATGMYKAKHPADVKALVGKTLTVQGFVMPYTPDKEFRHFLLTRYTPVCQFCPPGAPNEVIDVSVEIPVKWADRLFTVTGKFAIQDDGEKGVFFRLDNATVQ